MPTETNTPEVFSLKAARLNRGLTLDAAAEASGVPRHVLFHAEGGAQPRPAAALKIAVFYGQQVTDIWPVENAA